MNKAFVREPEDSGQAFCPRCGSLGTPATRAAVDRHVATAPAATLSDPVYFCSFARCEAAYFDLMERVLDTEALLEPVYPKDPSAPICGCFGFTLDDIEQDVAEGGVRRVRELLAKSKSPQAQCAQLAVSGQCCMGEVQKIFLKLRGG